MHAPWPRRAKFVAANAGVAHDMFVYRMLTQTMAAHSMRRRSKFAAALLVGMFAAVAPLASAQLKVAVVDTAQAIQQSEEAKSFAENLQQELEPESEDLRTLRDEIVTLEQRVADEGDVMSETEQLRVAKEIENKKIDLDFGAKKLEKALQDRQAELLQTVAPKVRAIVNDLVEVERYDLVFERRNVAYVNARHDITAKVTEKLNERYAEEEP